MFYRLTIIILILLVSVNDLLAQSEIFWMESLDVAVLSFGNKYPRISLDGNEDPVISWGNEGKVYFSRKNESVFTEPLLLNVDNILAYTANWTGPDIIARNDTVYVCYMDQDWNGGTYLAKSFDGGTSFYTPVPIESYNGYSSRFPTIMIDKQGNPLAAVMKMETNGHKPNYVLRYSTDYGNSFSEETEVSGWSGINSEACDCCPASIFGSNDKIAILYRDNLDNVRDVWAGVSYDGGISFDNGFQVDNNSWQLSSCPASGPDGVIVDNYIYAVFLSGNSVYLSRTNIMNGQIESIEKLGETGSIDPQNFPRISSYNNQVAISWREYNLGYKLKLVYFEDIINSDSYILETVPVDFFYSADISLGSNGIHLAIESTSSATVKYIHGSFSPSSVKNSTDISIKLSPNPVKNILNIKNYQQIELVSLYDINGHKVLQKKGSEKIDISGFENGYYIVHFILENGDSFFDKILKLN